MKNIKFYLSFLAVFSLLLTSCSKDEESGMNPDSEKATLSFGAIVQDLANKNTNKQSDIGDIPVCTDDTPAYVEIVLSHDGAEIVGTEMDPFRVDLVAGQLFTKEVPELELEPGNYSLEHFSVYNSEGDLIWLAPKGGVLAEFVDNPLPLDINLGAGVKKYVDVSVLCYDDRDVNEYGYLFFELDTHQAFEYCFFANYCTPEGRHWPAHFSVEISIDGNVLYAADANMNTVGVNDDGDFFASPICFALPDLEEYGDDEEYIDYVITLQDWEGAYGDVEQMVISGSLSRNEVKANFDGDDNLYYDHQRFGCDDEQQPVDSDGDGVDDSIDQCPGTESGVEVDAFGCPVTQEPDADGDGVPDATDNCPEVANAGQEDFDGDGIGDICDPDDDNDGVNDDVDDCVFEAGPAENNGCPVVVEDADGDGVPDSTDNCPEVANAGQEDFDGDGIGDVCDPDDDNDGVNDDVDDCVFEAGPAENNGCPIADADGDGVADSVDNCPNTANADQADADNDGIGDVCDDCVNEAGPADNNGCPVVVQCSIEGPDASCSEAYLEGETGWVAIPDPGELPDPYFLYAAGDTSTSLGSVTVSLDNGNPVIFINDSGLDDYLVEVSQNSDGSGSVCQTAENIDPPATQDDPEAFIEFSETYTYPFYVRIKANVCPN